MTTMLTMMFYGQKCYRIYIKLLTMTEFNNT